MTDKRNRDRIVDRKWEQIFHDYNVLEKIELDGVFTITSSEINKYKEARLMTKFDYVTQLPDIFYYNDLTILPTYRGGYIIGHFNAYYKMQTRDKTLLKNRKEIQFPSWIESIEPKVIKSESIMLNAAAASGMIEDALGEKEIVHTISGRMSSGKFSFSIEDLDRRLTDKYLINVSNSIVEIDAAYETPTKLLLFEAKNNTTDTFIVRQLYYPYQLWAKKMNKEVIPIFLQYANDTFNFSIFRFNDINNYNSLELLERRNYVFSGDKITIADLINIYKNVNIVKEPIDIPIPQANSMNKILGVLESINNSEDGFVTNEDLTLENDYVLRQADYYTRACMYLDLIRRDSWGYVLSRTGKKYIDSNRRKKDLLIAEKLLEHEPIRQVFERGLKRGEPLNGPESFKLLEKIEDKENTFNLNITTRRRRASTVSSWVKYLFSLSN